jgi:hypothetical protein
MRLAAAVLLLLATGCAAAPRQPIVVNFSNYSKAGVREWTRRIAAKNPKGSTILFCHGVDQPGDWTLRTKPDNEDIDTRSVAYTLHRLYHLPTYLISCNCRGSKLDMPGVFYSPIVVWQDPGEPWRIVCDKDTYKLVKGVGDVSGLVEGGN